MEDIRQSDGFINQLVSEMRDDTELWHAVTDRTIEGNLIQKISAETGKRWDLESEFFPERKRPSLAELTSSFLKKKFGQELPHINNQLIKKVVTLARIQVQGV